MITTILIIILRLVEFNTADMEAEDQVVAGDAVISDDEEESLFQDIDLLQNHGINVGRHKEAETVRYMHYQGRPNDDKEKALHNKRNI